MTTPEPSPRPTVRCQNCGNLIVPSNWSPTGWTHGDAQGRDVGLWVGKRCQGGITGATPDPDQMAAAHQAGRKAAAREILAATEDNRSAGRSAAEAILTGQL